MIIDDDSSYDGTGEVSEGLVCRHPRVRVIHHKENRGYGVALKTGFTSAKNDYIFCTDGDNQFDVRELKKLLALIGLSDLVVGFRIHKCYTPYRSAASSLYNHMLQVLFRLQYRDVNCAFKLVPKYFINRISIELVGFFVDVDLLTKAQLLGYSVAEAGVNHYRRSTGLTAINLRLFLSTLKEMVWFYFRNASRSREVHCNGRPSLPGAES